MGEPWKLALKKTCSGTIVSRGPVDGGNGEQGPEAPVNDEPRVVGRDRPKACADVVEGRDSFARPFDSRGLGAKGSYSTTSRWCQVRVSRLLTVSNGGCPQRAEGQATLTYNYDPAARAQV